MTFYSYPFTGIILTGMILACFSIGHGQDLRFTISPETTYFTEPRTEGGRVDYAKIINEYQSRGVQVDDNAVVLLYQASGRIKQNDAFYEALGVTGFIEPDQILQDLNVDFAGDLSNAIENPWTAQDHPELLQWLENNDKAMDLIFAASLKNGYYSPYVVGKNEPLMNVNLPGVQEARVFAMVFTCRAMLRLGQGNTTAAWNDLMVVHRLGRLVARGPSIIERLAGISIERLAITSELKLISAYANSSKLTLYRFELERLAQRVPLIDSINLGARLISLDMLTILAAEKFSFERYFDLMGGAPQLPEETMRYIDANLNWDDILRLNNLHYSAILEKLSKPSFSEQSKKINIPTKYTPEESGAIIRDIEQLRKLSKAELTDLVAPWFVASLAGSQETIVGNQFAVEQTSQNLLVAFALTEWLRKNGSYPDSLDLLTPEYLINKPLDLFTGEPLAYKRTEQGCRFYSVGPNSAEDRDDIVVELGLGQK